MGIFIVKAVGVRNGELGLSGQISEKVRPDLDLLLLGCEIEARQDAVLVGVNEGGADEPSLRFAIKDAQKLRAETDATSVAPYPEKAKRTPAAIRSDG